MWNRGLFQHGSEGTAIAVVFLSAIFALATGVRAETWNIDPVHSNISFSVRHMMLSDVKGEFRQVLRYRSRPTSTDPNSVKIEATIHAASVDTHAEKRDNHLKSPDFLDVAKYPTITFKSTKIEPDGDGKWKVTGNLTLHGVTKPVVLEVTGPTPEVMVMGSPRRGGRGHDEHQSAGFRCRV